MASDHAEASAHSSSRTMKYHPHMARVKVGRIRVSTASEAVTHKIHIDDVCNQMARWVAMHDVQLKVQVIR